MSKVTIKIEINEFICSCLAEMRDMNKARDYSGLSAVIERVQRHANAMEEGLYSYNRKMEAIRKVLDNDKMNDSQKLKRVKKLTERKESK